MQPTLETLLDRKFRVEYEDWEYRWFLGKALVYRLDTTFPAYFNRIWWRNPNPTYNEGQWNIVHLWPWQVLRLQWNLWVERRI
jgi:hypothetical protein